MTQTPVDILIIGYGNPGRLDDGLGPALAEAVDRFGLPGVTVDSDYQLTVEHAEAVARHRAVVFADAARQCDGLFSVEQVQPAAAAVRFTSHHLSAADVLALARDLFDARPDAYQLAIRGDRFDEFGIGLSSQASEALEAAVDHLVGMIQRGRLTDGTSPAPENEDASVAGA